jgi:hypothetical protein
MFFLLTKRSTKIPQIVPVNAAIEDLSKPLKNYGATTLKNIFSRLEIFIDSSIIDPFVIEILESYCQRGR